jgi:hypothetical protein
VTLGGLSAMQKQANKISGALPAATQLVYNDQFQSAGQVLQLSIDLTAANAIGFSAHNPGITTCSVVIQPKPSASSTC